jgi:hypothetical protein
MVEVMVEACTGALTATLALVASSRKLNPTLSMKLQSITAKGVEA